MAMESGAIEGTNPEEPRPPRWLRRWALPLAACLVVLAYANHFHNAFHFDDFHTIVNNGWITSPANIPRFFLDGATFSIQPPNRSYRPLVSTSLAIDYWTGGSLDPLWFHVSTFLWFLLQLALMLAFFRQTLRRAWPGTPVFPVALLATAIYGLHPAIAETINYVIQRGDVYSTLGVIAGLVIYIGRPGLRQYGLYLLPVAAGLLSKPPAAVFPALLLLWIWWFEEVPFREAALQSVPALLVTAGIAWFTVRMTPPSFVPGGDSKFFYIVTQPAVLLRYFAEFFLPLRLTIDTGRQPFYSVFQPAAIAGYLFIAAMLAAIVWCARRRRTRPIAFGFAWYLITSLPTSLIPLAEVENDHRMYFPFVGLVLSLCSAAALGLERRHVSVKVLTPACALLLAALAWGTHQRNNAWYSEETLWSDSILKYPRNGRGLVTYGQVLLARHDNAGALTMFERAQAFTPNYYQLETDLGVVWAAIGDPVQAKRHFLRAIDLGPLLPGPRGAYAHWLTDMGNYSEAVSQLQIALQRYPDNLLLRHTLLLVYERSGDNAGLRRTAVETLALFPSDVASTLALEYTDRK